MTPTPPADSENFTRALRCKLQWTEKATVNIGEFCRTSNIPKSVWWWDSTAERYDSNARWWDSQFEAWNSQTEGVYAKIIWFKAYLIFAGCANKIFFYLAIFFIHWIFHLFVCFLPVISNIFSTLSQRTLTGNRTENTLMKKISCLKFCCWSLPSARQN